MENPQEFLDRNLEELKALQIDEVKVIDGVRLKGVLSHKGCQSCVLYREDIDCRNIDTNCFIKGYTFTFAFVEVDENDNLKNEMELNSLENE